MKREKVLKMVPLPLKKQFFKGRFLGDNGRRITKNKCFYSPSPVLELDPVHINMYSRNRAPTAGLIFLYRYDLPIINCEEERQGNNTKSLRCVLKMKKFEGMDSG